MKGSVIARPALSEVRNRKLLQQAGLGWRGDNFESVEVAVDQLLKACD